LEETIKYIVTRLTESNIRYEIHRVPSGAAMVDIWINGSFYVVQLFDGKIGLSNLKDNPGFDTIPDTTYDDFEKFQVAFSSLLKS